MSVHESRTVALLGWPVEHSLSPAIQNAAFRALGLDWTYVLEPTRPGMIGEAIADLSRRGIAGANVTAPHKEAVIEHLDHVSEQARLVGAVNTLVRGPGGTLSGTNTDGEGFLADLVRSGVDPAGLDVLVIGAGGSARAVTHALASAGVRGIEILNRTVRRAEALASRLHETRPGLVVGAGPFPDALDEALGIARLVVSCTPLGLTDEHDFSDAPLRDDQVVYDLVYGQPTSLLERAAARGALGIGGLGMLVHQGALSFEVWTGMKAPVESMWKAAKSEVRPC